MDYNYFLSMDALLTEFKGLDYNNQFSMHHVTAIIWEVVKAGRAFIPAHMAEWFKRYAKLDFNLDIQPVNNIIASLDKYDYPEYQEIAIINK